MSTYVYGIVRDRDDLDGMKLSGVGEEGAPVRFVRGSGLAAAVSDAPEGLRAKRRDLTAHQNVLQDLAEAGAVLPLRFGSLSEDDDAVAAELARSADHYSELLDRLRDRVEFNVKAEHVEEAVLAEALRGDAGLRAENEALREAGGGSPAERMAFGERVHHAVEELRRRDAAVLRPLQGFADGVGEGEPVGASFVNTSFLVPRDRVEGFLKEAARLQQEAGSSMEIRVNGPLPPYSFVTPPPNRPSGPDGP
ncbi:GvpL/GvpF family gas vesicle protein [Nocardiopsis changdeensis]|uniref:GvpL/GvpF family gas vesicle protein n=1 Tax=Nocardiopsis changdeensis TaxID=2831969 RepID=A0ABX8BLT9_9ACTN|nr:MULTISPECIES: GvpL/GvpF family gas vesicle protein [Nocardiopsis]QUX23195.1 GvpL/GvpF family gas vesicle protein [Nocardiopsis changdeensis]QYX39138.1 GvpL/GvpF family gas vesicle protein [Nocardiopsis sp. MT53]